MSTTNKASGPRSPGQQARAEAAEYRGVGRSGLATLQRRRRILRLLLRGYTIRAIAEQTGLSLHRVETDVADLAREQLARVTGFDLRHDAADQLARFEEHRVMLLEDIAALDARHPNRPRLWAELARLEQTRHVFLERAGLRKPLDQNGPVDASDLRGQSTAVIETELAHVARQLYARLDPAAYMRAVEAMRLGDIVDVPALPAGETDDGGSGSGDGDA